MGPRLQPGKLGTDGSYRESPEGVSQVMDEDTAVYLSNSRDTVPMTGVQADNSRGLVLVALLLLTLGGIWITSRVFRRKRLMGR